MHKILFYDKFIVFLYMFRAHVIIIRSKLYYTVSGIVTPVGGRPVHSVRQDSLNLCTGRPPDVQARKKNYENAVFEVTTA